MWSVKKRRNSTWIVWWNSANPGFDGGGNMALRDGYQRDSYASVFRELIERDRRSTVLIVPTGGGKTVIASEIAHDWPYGKVAFIAHRKKLLDQAGAKLTSVTGESPVFEIGSLRASVGDMYGRKVFCCSKDSLHEERLWKFKPEEFGLIITDECHRAVRSNKTWNRVFEHFGQNPNCKILGLTATPFRGDRVGLVGDDYVFQSIAYQYPLWSATEPSALTDGWLVPPVQERVVCSKVDLSRLRVNRDGDWSNEQLAAEYNRHEVLYEIAKGLVERAGNRPTIVFLPTVNSCTGYQDEQTGTWQAGLVQLLHDLKPRCATAVYRKDSTGKTLSDLEIEYEFSRFARGDVQFLCSCDLLIEGFDETTVACVAICRPTRFKGRAIQMVGRGLRPLGSLVPALHAAQSAAERKRLIAQSAKPDCLVLNFGGVQDTTLTCDLTDILLDREPDDPILPLAREWQNQHPELDLEEVLEHAREDLWRQQTDILLGKRRAVLEQIEVTSYLQDALGGYAFDDGYQPPRPKGRTPASAKQIRFLQAFGVQEATAMNYTKRQAGAVLNQYKSERCTLDQARRLLARGQDPKKFNYDSAKEFLWEEFS